MGYIADVTVGGVNHPVGSSLYGTCDTAAGTAAKVVTMANFDTLKSGVSIHVKFDNINTANSPTLNVNSTGAKNIYYRGAQITTGDTKSLIAGLCDFVYDGTQWYLVGSQEIGGGAMMVTFTRTGSVGSSTFTADKTYAEIQAALNAGKTVFGVSTISTSSSNDDCYVFHVDKYDKGENSSNSYLVFSYHGISDNGVGQYYYYYHTFRMSYNNSVFYDSHSYPFDYGDLSFYMLAEYITGDTPEEGGYFITHSSINDFTAFLNRDYYNLPRDMATGVLVVASNGQYDGDSYYTDPEYGSTWYNQHFRAFSEIFYFSDCSVSSEYYANNGDPYFVDFATLTFKNMDNTKTATVQTQIYNWDLGYGTPVTITETGMGGVMWVNITYNANNNAYTVDKTHTEIMTAINNNQAVLCKFIYQYNNATSYTQILTLYEKPLTSSANIVFQYVGYSPWGYISIHQYYITSSNVVGGHNQATIHDYPGDGVPTAFIYVYYDPDHVFDDHPGRDYYVTGIGASGNNYVDDITFFAENPYGVFLKLMTAWHDDGVIDSAEILYLTNIENTYDLQGDWSSCTLQFENSTRTITIQGTPWTYDYLNDVTITSTPNSGGGSGLPTAPANDGTYILKCVVSSGTPTYSWEAVQSGSGVQF